MTPRKKTSASQFRKRTAVLWPTALVLLLGLFLRITLRSEVILDQGVYSYEMARDAWDIATVVRNGINQPDFFQALNELRGSQGIGRLVLNLPLALMNSLFGFSRLATVSYSLIAGTINMLLVFLIGRRLFSTTAGLVATLLWTLVPSDVLLSGVVSNTAPLLSLGMLAALCAIKAIAEHSWREFAFTAFLTLGTLFLNPALGAALIVLLLVTGVMLWAHHHKLRRDALPPISQWAAVAAVWLLLTWAFSVVDLQSLFASFVAIANLPGVFLLLVLLFASVAVLFRKTPQRTMVIVAWLVAGLVGLGIALEQNGLIQAVSSPSFALLLVPVAIAGGAYFDGWLHQKTFGWILLPVSITFLASAAVVFGAHNLVTNFASLDLTNANFVLNMASISAGLAVLGLILLPLAPPRVHTSLAVLVMCIFMFASIPAVWQTVLPYRETLRAAEQGLATLQGQPLRLPVYFTLNSKRNLYTYLQGFDEQSSPTRLSFRTDAAGLEQVETGYIVIPERDTAGLSHPDWVEIASTGTIHARDQIFRVLHSQAADEEFDEAQALVLASPNPANLLRLAQAQANLGNLCDWITNWMMAAQTNGKASSLPLVNGLDCFNPVLGSQPPIARSDFQYSSLASILPLEDGTLDSEIWRVNQREFIYPDGRAFVIKRTIKPNTFYVYSGLFRAKEEATFLYWKTPDWEGFNARRTAPDWTNFGVLIFTGDVMEATEIELYPTLVENYGFVDLSEIRFIEISEPQAFK